tara:strand:+ start:3578 stop:4429 length:852 start_codon:yes stop_codon:yes gene_type:complete
MKVGIIGYGFVGSALKNGLKDNVEVLKIDPKLNTNISMLKTFNPDIIFLCLPTPVSDDGSLQDISKLEEAIKDIIAMKMSCLVVIKSTVLPNYLKSISGLYEKLIHNPEFLREVSADEDFINSKLIVFGGEMKYTKTLASFYKKHTKCISDDYIFTDIISASFIKYTINSFLSTKVIFFNELKKLFDKSGTKQSWENFILAITKDERIGNSHMQVPGPDGRYGFGGACLPKDSKAFVEYADKMNQPLEILQKVVNLNIAIRSSYEELIEREESQNIKFFKELY